MADILTITTEDLVEAILEAQSHAEASDGTALTVAEISDRTGLGLHQVYRRLHMLYQSAKIEVVRVKRLTMIGTVQTVPAYRRKPATKLE